MDFITTAVNEFIRQQREYTERTLAELITKYDFIVGSKECKCKLMEAFPEGANVICSPYVESPTTIYAIKKFDTMDLLSEPYRADFHCRPKETILDKIKDEIEQDAFNDVNGSKFISVNRVNQIIDEYKEESEKDK